MQLSIRLSSIFTLHSCAAVAVNYSFLFIFIIIIFFFFLVIVNRQNEMRWRYWRRKLNKFYFVVLIICNVLRHTGCFNCYITFYLIVYYNTNSYCPLILRLSSRWSKRVINKHPVHLALYAFPLFSFLSVSIATSLQQFHEIFQFFPQKLNCFFSILLTQNENKIIQSIKLMMKVVKERERESFKKSWALSAPKWEGFFRILYKKNKGQKL